MHTARWPALLLLLLSTHPCLAQVKLEWKFQEGETFFTERIYTQKQVVDVKGKRFKQESAKTVLTSVTVKEKTPAGQVLAFKIEAVSVKTTGPAVQGGLDDDKMAALMKGTTFSAAVTAHGKLTKLEGYEAFVQKLAEKNAEREKQLRKLLSEDSVREGLEEMFALVPDRAVKKGDKWKREATEPVAPFGSFKSAFEYSLEEVAGDEAIIAYKVKMTYRPSSEADLFRVVKGGLQAEDGKGSFVFDHEKGRLLRGEKNIHIKGDIVIAIDPNGAQTPMEFTSDNTLKIRVFTK